MTTDRDDLVERAQGAINICEDAHIGKDRHVCCAVLPEAATRITADAERIAELEKRPAYEETLATAREIVAAEARIALLEKVVEAARAYISDNPDADADLALVNALHDLAADRPAEPTCPHRGKGFAHGHSLYEPYTNAQCGQCGQEFTCEEPSHLPRPAEPTAQEEPK